MTPRPNRASPKAFLLTKPLLLSPRPSTPSSTYSRSPRLPPHLPAYLHYLRSLPPPRAPAHHPRSRRYGPQPAELGGQRALDFVLDNTTLRPFNRTLLFDIKLLAVRKQR